MKKKSSTRSTPALEQYWHDRLTYPTGRFDPAWVRAAATQHARMASGVPAGAYSKLNLANPLPLTPFWRGRRRCVENHQLLQRLYDMDRCD